MRDETILLVEDDEKLGAEVQAHLQSAGYAVQWERDGTSAGKRDPQEFAMIILDLMLPGTYGLDLLKRYRASSDVPVLILSARQDAADKVRALKLGADDYMTKPFWPQELIERVRARLRRPDMRGVGESLLVGALSLDEQTRQVLAGGAPIEELTKVEFEILRALAKRPDSAITRRALANAALPQGNERTLDVHVSRLRKKLGEHGEQLKTVWGIGYKLTKGE